jgi:hypothetical protein
MVWLAAASCLSAGLFPKRKNVEYVERMVPEKVEMDIPSTSSSFLISLKGSNEGDERDTLFIFVVLTLSLCFVLVASLLFLSLSLS